MCLRLVGEAERGVAQRDQHLQPRHAVGDVEHRVAQIADFAGQPAQIAAIEFAVGVAEHQRRLRQQRDHAARQHVGAAAERPLARRIGDPVVDQRAGIGAGQRGIGGAQMPQPAEAEQRHFPVFRRRLEIEDRAAVAGHDLAGEHEAAGIDFGGAGGVGGAQIVRRDDQAVGAARPQPRQRHRAAAGARHHAPRKAAHDQRRDASALSDRHACLEREGGYCRRILLIRKRRQDTLLKTGESPEAARNSGVKSGFNQPRRVKAVQPAEPRVGVGQMAGQGAQIAVGGDDFGRGRRPRRPSTGARRTPDSAASSAAIACSPSSGSSEQVQ